MSAPQLLNVGSKLIGLYFIVLSAPILLSLIVGWLFSSIWERFGDAPIRIYIAVSTAGLIVLISSGWGLIRMSDSLLRYVFRENTECSGSRVRDTFTIGVKLFGAFVAMSEFLSFMRLVTNYFMSSSLFGAYGNTADTVGVATNFMPSMISVVAGLLLFFRGELLADWAFAERISVGDDDANG